MTTRKVDLNLFRLFDVVMSSRSVSVAAQELGVTASAVSHALARLRRITGDDLFTAGESGMEPTQRALLMSPGVREALGLLAAVLGTPAFDPSTSTRRFSIAATDYSCVTILSRLLGRIAVTAPGIGLRVFPLGRMDAIRHLDEGRIDLALNWFDRVPERMCRLGMATEQEAIVVRPGHPLTRGAVTKQRLFAFPHIVVELTGSQEQAADGFTDERGVLRRTWVERLLLEMSDEAQGLIGRVAVTVPSYAAVPPMLQATDMVATLPRSLALREAAHGCLVILDLPYKPLDVQVDALWHQRADRDAGLRWLVAEMTEAMRTVADRP